MKRLLIFAAVLSLGMTACQKSESVDAALKDVQISVSTLLPSQLDQTRAAGDGTTVDRCIMEIYLDGKLYGERQVAEIQNLKAVFSPRLVAGNTYEFVFWADKSGGDLETDLHYNTSDLSNVTFAEGDVYQGNDETRDAFFGTATVIADQNKSVSVDMKRPFGQLNVRTLDMQAVADASASYVPEKVSVAFVSVPTGINLFTGALNGETAAVAYSEPVALANNAGNAGELTFDYIFAPAGTEQYLTDFTMSFLDASGAEVAEDYAFTSIPVQRNYRTMVSGNLLTKKADITVNVIPDFGDGDIEANVDRVQTVADANEAFANGATVVEITEAPTSDARIILPKTVEGVYITMPVTTVPVTIEYADAATDEQKPATVNVSGELANLIINAPNSTVTIDGSYNEVTSTTAANSLIIGEEASVESLTVKQGNVEVYGTLKNLVSRPGSAQVTLHAATADDLRAFAAHLNDGGNKIYDNVVLEADIDFEGSEFYVTRVNNVVLDGQGHKISNYKVEKNTQSAGLFCDAVTVTVKNLTLENAEVKAINDGAGNAYAGALLGRTYGTITVSDVHVVNPTIEGVNKVGGLVGFIAENSITATGCTVEGGSVTTSYVEGESGQIGGLIGYLGSLFGTTCTISGCSVENTVINAHMTREDRTISKFIGCFQGNQATDVLIIDNCRVENVTLNPLDDMAAAYFSEYGDLLGGQRNGQGTVKITNSNTDIVIESKAQLASLAASVNAGNSYAKKQFVLGADIDLGNEAWTPIGKSGSAFQGVFDGKGHVISNLYIDTPSKNDVGLFGFTTNGEIKNLTVHNAFVKGYLDVGVVAGTPYTSKYTNITLTGTIQVEGFSYVGGMFGKNAYANLTDLTIDADEESYVYANSVEGTVAYRTYVGGVIGFIGEGGHVISDVVSNIDVTGTTCDVGGITGIAHYGNSFVNCSSSGKVTLTNAQDTGDQLEIGGIAGVWMNKEGTTVTFSGCSFTGTLTTYLNGEDYSAAVAETNKITGAAYNRGSTDGELIIE